MGKSILIKAIVYSIMGVAFIYIGIQSKVDTVWNPVTLIFAAVAAMDFWLVLKLLSQYFRIKKKKE
ncbi:YdiK family protein [Oceanobacillus damuensis]|uniref:YdiK family protein n=1 Tax=Oceanobacillus damuensis TaxID=937928 RepID=UPI000833D952|nr:YdiK family protein [Oceanobacillus damuensis]